MEADSTALDSGLAVPAAYVPSRELERHRQLAEVGAVVAPSAGGTVYCQLLPVRLRDPRLLHDVARGLVVRVGVNNNLDGTASGGPHSLIIEIYDDREPTALLRREIEKQEFEALREEQRLLVSFEEFPQTIVQLLHSCGSCDTSRENLPLGDPPGTPRETSQPVASPLPEIRQDGLILVALLVLRCEDAPAPSAALNARGLGADLAVSSTVTRAEFHRWSVHGQGTPALYELPAGSGVRHSLKQPVPEFTGGSLYLIETNNYRELNHLHLKFDRCSAMDTLRHLAGRIGHHKLYSLSLEHELCRVDAHRRHWAHLFRELRTRSLQLLQQSRSALTSTERRLNAENKAEAAEYASQLASASAAASAAVEEARCKAAAAQAEVDSMKQRIAELETVIAELKNGKYNALENMSTLEGRERQTQEKLRTAESALSELKAERDTLATALHRSQGTEAELQTEVARLRIKGPITEEEVAASVSEAVEKEKKVFKEKEKKLRQALTMSAEEIDKGNTIIAKLQGAVRKERELNQRLASGAEEITDDLSASKKTEIKLLQQISNLKQCLEESEACQRVQQHRIQALERRLTQSTIENVVGGGTSTTASFSAPGDIPRLPLTVGPLYDDRQSLDPKTFLGPDTTVDPPIAASRMVDQLHAAPTATPPASKGSLRSNRTRSHSSRRSRSASPPAWAAPSVDVPPVIVKEVSAKLPCDTEPHFVLECDENKMGVLSFGRAVEEGLPERHDSLTYSAEREKSRV